MSNLTFYYNISKIYKKYFKLKNKNLKFIILNYEKMIKQMIHIQEKDFP